LLLVLLVLLPLHPAAAQPLSIDARYQAGAEAFQAGRPYEALEILSSVAAENPGYRDVQMLLGQSCLVVGLLVPAKHHFENALQANPGNGFAAYLLGFTLYQSARYFEADQALTRAHDLAPANPNPLVYRGLARLRLGRAEDARRDIETALAQAPRDPTARGALAELELAAGHLDRAEALARDVAADEPRSPDPKLLLARVLLEAGEAAQAIPVAEEVLAAFPHRSDALYLLAQAQLRSGAKDAGRATLTRFQKVKQREERLKVLQVEVKTDPDDVASRKELVELLLEQGQVGDALLHLAVLQKLAPNDPEVRRLSAEVETRRRGGG
jgi:tetratricopeptide (TPR) repeat protein